MKYQQHCVNHFTERNIGTLLIWIYDKWKTCRGPKLYTAPDEHSLSNPNSWTLWYRCRVCLSAHSLLPRTPDQWGTTYHETASSLDPHYPPHKHLWSVLAHQHITCSLSDCSSYIWNTLYGLQLESPWSWELSWNVELSHYPFPSQWLLSECRCDAASVLPGPG